MANTVAVKFIENGDKNVLVHVYLKSDGVTGELTDQTLVDPVVDLGMLPGARLRLSRIEYNFSGFDCVLSFGSGTVDPNFKWVMTEGANAPVDFERWGRIYDDSGLDGNEKLQISTTWFTNSGDQGSMLIRLVK